MQPTPLFTATPSDLLFFRDGRPIEAGGGHGARWPEPSLIFDALHAALHRAFPLDEQTTNALGNCTHDWEHGHRLGRSSDRDMNRARTQRFGSLATAGVFPVFEGRWLFPCPADAVLEADKRDAAPVALQPVRDASGTISLPFSWLKSVGATVRVGKQEPAAWWAKTAWEAWLAENNPSHTDLYQTSDIYAAEWTTGVGIDPERQTQDGTRIYSAEYLRLREKVALGFSATLPMKHHGQADSAQERIGALLQRQRAIIVGGQQRTCSVEPVNHGATLASVLPTGARISGTRVRWILLSPAVFPAIAANSASKIQSHPGGWLPNWINPENGNVLLRGGDIEREPGECRSSWRDRIRRGSGVNARLVAARVPKLRAITGWSERLHLAREDAELVSQLGLRTEHGPRSTHLAVPAGAVYYFECHSANDAVALANALNWHGDPTAPDAFTTIKNRRSTLLGEKGFGLGVCGTWHFHGATRA